MRTDILAEALRHLETMAADHLRWLRELNGALFFDGPSPVRPIRVPVVLDAWAECATNGDDILERQTAVTTLRRYARTLDTEAAALVSGRKAGGPVERYSYNHIMATSEAFGALLRRLNAWVRQELAEIDPLTGAHNRQAMARELAREWTRAIRTGEACTVAVVDLDNFKRINDDFGHPFGDAVLRQAARFFRRRLRPYDLLYRYGGEEFLFCLPNSDLAQARRVLERMRLLMARLPVRVNEHRRLTVTVSIGIAQMRENEAPDETIARADRAMYAAKAAGRNRLCIDISENLGADELSTTLVCPPAQGTRPDA